MGVNGILLLDKDEGWTSQDCVSKLRGILGERRIGHAGTLDPLATGLLVVLVGRATRAAAFAEAETKEYIAAFRPGIVTDTQDITGNLLRSSDVLPSEEDVRAALPRFTGEIEQIPPMYSAIKINGRKLYDIARHGGEVEREARRITIHSIDYLGQENGDHMLRIRCSKGTYIRTLCHDIGAALGCGGVMSALRRTEVGGYRGCGGCMAALRRTRSGSFSVENARRIGELTRADRDTLLPADTLFSAAASLTLTAAQEKRCRCGNPFRTDAPDGETRFYSENGEFLAIGRVANGEAVTVKSFFEV